jgi:hypothetical protein
MENTVWDFELGKCAECPQIQDILKLMDSINEDLMMSAQRALDPTIDDRKDKLLAIVQLTTNITDQRPRNYLTGEEIITSDDAILSYRQYIARLIEQNEELRDSIKADCEASIDHCDGPLTMQSEKAGRKITAIVCNSPVIDDGFNDRQAESVTIIRERSS